MSWYKENWGCKKCKKITGTFKEWESEFSMKTEMQETTGKLKGECDTCGNKIEHLLDGDL